MKTTEQILKGIEFRQTKLAQQLIQLKENEDKPGVKAIYQSVFERHNEVTAMLNFIKDEQTGCNTCGGCPTPCSKKNNE